MDIAKRIERVASFLERKASVDEAAATLIATKIPQSKSEILRWCDDFGHSPTLILEEIIKNPSVEREINTAIERNIQWPFRSGGGRLDAIRGVQRPEPDEPIRIDQSGVMKGIPEPVRRLLPKLPVVAWNTSSWFWEYDEGFYYAVITMEPNTGNLWGSIIKRHVKTGIGAGEQVDRMWAAGIGTLQRPRLGAFKSAMAKYKYDKSRSGGPYKKTWRPAWSSNWNERMPLQEIFDEVIALGYKG